MLNNDMIQENTKYISENIKNYIMYGNPGELSRALSLDLFVFKGLEDHFKIPPRGMSFTGYFHARKWKIG